VPVAGAARRTIVENTFQGTAAGPRPGSTLLRRALRLDAVASGAMGAAMALAAALLAGWFDLPAALLRGAGLALVPFAALLAYLAARDPLPRPAVLAVVAVNLVWVAGSLLVLVVGWVEPTALGVAFVVVQAVAVAGFAGLQEWGLRRGVPDASSRR
jgi:hypothetical protein